MKTFQKRREKPLFLKINFDFDCGFPWWCFWGINFDPVLEFTIKEDGFDVTKRNAIVSRPWSDVVEACLITRIYTLYGQWHKHEWLRLRLKSEDFLFSISTSLINKKLFYFENGEEFLSEFKKYVAFKIDYKDYAGLHALLIFVYLAIAVLFYIIFLKLIS